MKRFPCENSDFNSFVLQERLAKIEKQVELSAIVSDVHLCMYACMMV